MMLAEERMARTRRPNPYRPGFNQAPEVLAGRDEVLDAAREALAVAALDGRTPPPLILVGSRGVGKTVLLGAIAELAAEEHGWLTVAVEVRPGSDVIPQIVERMTVARDLLDHAPTSPRFAFDVVRARLGVGGSGVEGQWARRDDPSVPELALDRALSDACDLAAERRTGVVLTIDETQAAGRGALGELAATLQQHVGENWPLVVVAAGLPSLRDPSRSITYLERADWHEIGLLTDDDARRALTGPAEDAGRPLDDDAADLLVAASGGYPFAVQLLGHHAWRAASERTRIDLAAARSAVPAADRALRDGLYAQRWADASPKEREYLLAVARLIVDEGAASGSTTAVALGATTTEVSYLRQRLLRKGTLVAVGRDLRFPVPGMADWVVEQA